MFFILSGAKIVSSYFPQQFFLDRVALYSIHFFAGYILNIKKECVASFIEKHMVIPIFIIATLIIYYIDARYGFLACDETPSYPWTGIVVLQSLEIIKQFLLIGIWVCIARKIVNKYPVFVENKIVKYFEKRSFDIFLYHWPVLLALLQYLPIESPIAKAMTTAFVCMGISLLVAEMVDFLKRVRARCSGLGA